MATVGAYVRCENDELPSLREQISRIDGLEPFDLDRPGTLGVVIEAENVDAAHAKLTQQVQSLSGVVGVWPVYVNIEDEQPTL